MCQRIPGEGQTWNQAQWDIWKWCFRSLSVLLLLWFTLSLSEDRLPLFLDACGRILLPEVPKFFVYCHAGPKRETAIYKFPDSQEVYWLSLFESWERLWTLCLEDAHHRKMTSSVSPCGWECELQKKRNYRRRAAEWKATASAANILFIFFFMCGLIKIGRIHKIDSDGVCVHTPVPRKLYLLIHMMHTSDARVLVRVLVYTLKTCNYSMLFPTGNKI